LLAEHGQFVEFVKKAHWNDAGQTAALGCFDADLGKVAGTFLGEGDWRPSRAALVDCWRSTGEAKEKSEAHDSPAEP
jgi:hypothetical protein